MLTARGTTTKYHSRISANFGMLLNPEKQDLIKRYPINFKTKRIFFWNGNTRYRFWNYSPKAGTRRRVIWIHEHIKLQSYKKMLLLLGKRNTFSAIRILDLKTFRPVRNYRIPEKFSQTEFDRSFLSFVIVKTHRTIHLNISTKFTNKLPMWNSQPSLGKPTETLGPDSF